MPAIRSYFDFASPYAYFALRPLEALASEHGCDIEYRPILLWPVLKAHGIAPPLDPAVRRAYFAADMVRSAAFHGVPYRHPEQLPVSSHLAVRLFHAVVHTRPELARPLAHALFDAFFVHGRDISRAETVQAVAAAQGLDPAFAEEAMAGPLGRRRLAETIDQAIADQVCGSPYIMLGREGFFGADRLPQLAWRLSGRNDALAPTAGEPP